MSRNSSHKIMRSDVSMRFAERPTEETTFTAGEEQEMDIRRMLSDWEASLGPDHPSIAAVAASLATLLEDQWRWAEAESLHRRTLSLHQKAYGDQHAKVADSLQSLARCAMVRNAYEEVETLLSRALKIRETEGSKAKHSECLELIAQLRLLLGQPKEAVAELEKALRIVEHADCRDDSCKHEVPRLMIKLGQAHEMGGDEAAARGLYAAAIRALRVQPDANREDLALVLFRQGTIEVADEKLDLAEGHLRECLRLRQLTRGCKDPVVAETMAALAQLLSAKRSDIDEAESLFQQAIDALEGSRASDQLQLAATFQSYGDHVFGANRFEDAELLYRNCLRLLRDKQADGEEEIIAVRKKLAVSLAEMGRLADAEQELRALLEIRERTSPDDLKAAMLCEGIADLISEDPARAPEAAELIERSLAIKEWYAVNAGLGAAHLADTMSRLGSLLKQCGRHSEGEQHCLRAEELRQGEISPEYLELEKFIRTGDLDSIAPVLPSRGREPRSADAVVASSVETIDCASPLVRVRSSGASAKMDSESLRRSKDFKQWAMNSQHLSNAFAKIRQKMEEDGRPEEGAGSPATPSGSADMAAPSSRPQNNRYSTLNMEDSLLELGQEDHGRQSAWEAALADDDVLMDTVQTSSISEMFREVDRGWAQPEAADETPGAGEAHGHCLAGNREGEVDVDDLLQRFMDSERFRTGNLEESLDELDEILQQARTDARAPARKAPEAEQAGSFNVDEMISSLEMEDLL
mmetsp:Transcript_34094/g.80889  ORF Transcript_34094/g.80889 Transcript_34094/m.80889 type:complete len:753 (-) Transcript_34094:47-2305(-)